MPNLVALSCITIIFIKKQQKNNNLPYIMHDSNYYTDTHKTVVILQKTYSNRVPSMLITSSKISSQVASTTPTAFIALLQLLGYIKKQMKIVASQTIP